MKRGKRFVGIALVLLMLLGSIPALNYSDLNWADLFGIKASAAFSIIDRFVPTTHEYAVPDGYQPIWSADDLSQILSNNRKNYILMDDIDMSGRVWSPGKFYGTFDGNGYSIKNLNCKKSVLFSGFYTTSGAGLFAGLFENACVKNVYVESISINLSYSDYAYVGGIAGYVSDTTVSIHNCAVTGSLMTEYKSRDFDSYVGGIVGGNRDIKISNCFSNITARGERAGGILGYAEQSSTINNCASISNLSGDYIGGLTSSVYSAKDCYYSSNAQTSGASNNTRVGRVDKNYILSGKCYQQKLNTTVPEGYQGVWFPDDLRTATRVNGSYILMNDIDLDGLNWESAPFTGILDGNGYSIKNLTCNKTYGISLYPSSWKNFTGAGLFATLGEGSIVKRLTLTNVNIQVSCSDYTYVGGLVGQIKGSTTIANCSVTGTIRCPKPGYYSTSYCGGLVGYQYAEGTTEIKYCNTNVDILGEYAAGIIAYADSSASVYDCYSFSTLSGNYCGGIASYYKGTIHECFASPIGTNAYGIVYSSSKSLKNCYYTHAQTAFDSVNNSERVVKLQPNELGIEASFVGFDFDSVWEIKNGQYPTFRMDKIKEALSDYYIRVIDKDSKEEISNAAVKVGTKEYVTSKTGGLRIPLSVVKAEATSPNAPVTIEIAKGTHKTLTLKSRDLVPGVVSTIQMESLTSKWGINGLFADALSTVQNVNCTLKGPTVDFFGEEQPLFSVGGGIDLSGLKNMLGNSVSLNTQVDTKKKVLKVVGGIKTSGLNLDSDMDYSADDPDNKFNSWYSQICNFNNSKPGVDKNGLFKKLYDNVEKSEGKFGFKVNISYLAYAQFDYSTGKLMLQEGGFSIIISATASADYPVCAAPPIYLTFKLTGEAEGKLKLTFKSTDIIEFSGSLGAALKPSIGVGLGNKYIVSGEVGIDGSIGISVDFPYKSFNESVGAYLSAQAYFKLTALKVFSKKWSTNFPNYILLPASESGFEHSNNAKKKAPAVSITNDDFELIGREYLVTENYGSRRIAAPSRNASLNESNVYENGNPKLIKLNNGNILAVWVYDDGSKTTANCTTLYYSIYKNNTWSVPTPVFESGRADMDISLCTDGNTVYAVWQRGSEVLPDSISLSEMLTKTELVYAQFDGTEWTTPLVIDEAGQYQALYGITTNGEDVAITWTENEEGAFSFASSETTVMSKVLSNGTWSDTSTVDTKNGITSLAVGYIDGSLSYAYCVDMDADFTTDGDSELFINGVRITNDELEDLSVTYQNNNLYWRKDGKLCTYVGSSIKELGMLVDAEYCVLSNGCVVSTQKDGFKSELVYFSNEGNGVQLSNYEKHIRSFSAILADDGSIITLQNIANMSSRGDSDPYTTTDMMLDTYTDFIDLSIDDEIYYDLESVKPNADIEIEATIRNQSLGAVDTYTVGLLDGGTVLSETTFTGELKTGETQVVTIPFTVPNDFEKKTLYVRVTAANDRDESNNTASFDIGYADIAVTDYSISEDGLITARIVNNGFDTAQNVNVVISKLINDFEPLHSETVEELLPGKEYSVQFPVSSDLIAFEDETTINHFTLEIATETEEKIVSNNKVDLWLNPVRVERVVLSENYLNMEIGESADVQAVVYPENSFNKSISWLSSDENVVTVDSSGHVVARGSGTAKISAISADGVKYDECGIVVNEVRHSVQYLVDDAIYAEFQIAENHPILLPNVPQKTGYEFDGWSPTVPELVGDGDLVFHSQWTAKAYTVTFDANEGTFDSGELVKEVSTLYGELPVITEIPTLEGKVFLGWSPEIQPVDDENLLYIAEWGEKSEYTYYVTFIADETVIAVVPYVFGENHIDEPAIPQKQCTVSRWETYALNNSDLTVHAEYTVQHNPVVDEAIDPTCSSAGKTEGSHCKDCGRVLEAQEEIAPLGHIDEDNDGLCDGCDKQMKGDGRCKYCGQIHKGFGVFFTKIIHWFLGLFGRTAHEVVS